MKKKNKISIIIGCICVIALWCATVGSQSPAPTGLDLIIVSLLPVPWSFGIGFGLSRILCWAFMKEEAA